MYNITNKVNIESVKLKLNRADRPNTLKNTKNNNNNKKLEINHGINRINSMSPATAAIHTCDFFTLQVTPKESRLH